MFVLWSNCQQQKHFSLSKYTLFPPHTNYLFYYWNAVMLISIMIISCSFLSLSISNLRLILGSVIDDLLSVASPLLLLLAHRDPNQRVRVGHRQLSRQRHLHRHRGRLHVRVQRWLQRQRRQLHRYVSGTNTACLCDTATCWEYGHVRRDSWRVI